MLTKSPAARTALVYVTAGAMIIIWCMVWWLWMANHPPDERWPYYILGGLMATGIVITLIGLGVGRLGSAARNADSPTVVVSPPGTTSAVVTPPNTAVAPVSAQPPGTIVSQPLTTSPQTPAGPVSTPRSAASP
jgi:hypothetical protein